MAVRLIHPGLSPHIFRGAHEVWFEGERYDVLNAQGVSILADSLPDLPLVAPVLAGGAIEIDGTDIVLVPPQITAGQPDPALDLTSLTRGGIDVRTEIVDNRISDAAPGVYVAVWTADNGVGQAAVRTASLTKAAAPPPSVAPQMTGGSLSRQGADLVITQPTVTAGNPAPTVGLVLTRGGQDVLDEVVDDRIVAAPQGDYLAVWTAANGVGTNATRTASLTVATDWDVTVGTNSMTIHAMPDVAELIATTATNSIIIEG